MSLRRAHLIALLAAAMACAGPGPSADGARAPCSPSGLLTEGERLPDCSFEGFEGRPDVRLAALRGKPLVLNFWASWCTFCIKEMPDFQRVFAELGDRVTFLGMDLLGIQAETRGAAEAFAARTGVRYRLAYDENGLLYGHFNARVQNPPLPLTVLVDAQGIVRQRHFGPLTDDALREQIATTLAVR